MEKSEAKYHLPWVLETYDQSSLIYIYIYINEL